MFLWYERTIVPFSPHPWKSRVEIEWSWLLVSYRLFSDQSVKIAVSLLRKTIFLVCKEKQADPIFCVGCVSPDECVVEIRRWFPSAPLRGSIRNQSRCRWKKFQKLRCVVSAKENLKIFQISQPTEKRVSIFYVQFFLFFFFKIVNFDSLCARLSYSKIARIGGEQS